MMRITIPVTMTMAEVLHLPMPAAAYMHLWVEQRDMGGGGGRISHIAECFSFFSPFVFTFFSPRRAHDIAFTAE